MNVAIAILASLTGLHFINVDIDIGIIPIITIVGLITIIANVTNDIIDSSIDRINRSDRPLPQGIILKNHLMIYFISVLLIVFYVVITSNAHYNGKLFSIFIILPTILLYNVYLKRLPIIGNLIVATILGSVFLFVELATKGAIEYTIEPFILASLLSFPREIIKDIEDIEGDKAHSLRTLPIQFGIEKSILIVNTSIAVLIVYSSYIYIYDNSFGIQYFTGLVVLIYMPLLYCFFVTTFKKDIDFSLISTVLKICTCFGLFVILCAKIT